MGIPDEGAGRWTDMPASADMAAGSDPSAVSSDNPGWLPPYERHQDDEEEPGWLPPYERYQLDGVKPGWLGASDSQQTEYYEDDDVASENPAEDGPSAASASGSAARRSSLEEEAELQEARRDVGRDREEAVEELVTVLTKEGGSALLQRLQVRQKGVRRLDAREPGLCSDRKVAVQLIGMR